MEALVEQSTGPRRFSMLLLGLFSLLAVGLASIGLYGVMSYNVTSVPASSACDSRWGRDQDSRAGAAAGMRW
jgi:hypothetical protein